MRVMCIKKCTSHAPGITNPVSPEVGDKDEVISEGIRDGLLYYKIARFQDFWYLSTNFAILPDQPEEVIEELEEATA